MTLFKHPAFSAFWKFAGASLFSGLTVFLPAGTIDYPSAWLFLGILFIPLLLIAFGIYFDDPELFSSFVESNEKSLPKFILDSICILIIVASMFVCGLDFRSGWTAVPEALSIIAAAGILMAFALFSEVLRSSPYVTVILIKPDSFSVPDTALYSAIRHPMYTAAILLVISMPLLLGSWAGFGVMLLCLPLLIHRVNAVEKVLLKTQEGYKEYKQRVPYKLLPHIW